MWMIGVWLSATGAYADELLDRLSVSMGLSGIGAEGPSGGALGVGYVSARAARNLYVDLGGRTGFLFGPLREATGVNLALRLHAGELLFLRAGLVHQHETPWDTFLEDPVGSLAGSAHGIGHRSGLDAGLGLRGTLPAISTTAVHVSLAALLTWLPDPDGPPLYGVLESTLTIDLGRKDEG